MDVECDLMLGIFVKTTPKKSYSSHILVLLQGIFLVLCCFPVGWYNAGSPWFLLLCAGGTALGLVVLYYNRPRNFSVYPEVREGAVLITDGPYRYIRHPMYTALITMMVGIACYNGHWINYVGVIGIVMVVTTKAFREERVLPEVFPEYEPYKSGTKRFVPYFL